MAEYTSNFNLEKQKPNEYISIEGLNENFDKIDAALGNSLKFEKAGGTGTAITLNGIALEDGHSKTFIASANNNGAATTINGKKLYKSGTTIAPSLIADKAVTVWYDKAKDCFFIKASAEGNATADHVLAGKTFSNDNDTGIVGTMPNNGEQSATLTTSVTSKVIPAGYTTGGNIDIVLEEKAANANQSTQDIVPAAGKVLSKVTVNPVTFDSSKLLSDTTIAGKQGTMPNNGAINQYLPVNGSFTIPKGYHNGSGKVNQSIATKGAQVYTPGTSDITIPSGQYLSGAQTIKGDVNLIPNNIHNGKSIFGVAGNVISGKRFASGTMRSTNTQDLFYQYNNPSGTAKSYIKISNMGLAFTPRIIIFLVDISGEFYAETLYFSDGLSPQSEYKTEKIGNSQGPYYSKTTQDNIGVGYMGMTYLFLAWE